MEERLQKILSSCGVASRRAVEKMLMEGRITVNGRPAGVGDKADPEQDEIAVDGTPVGYAGSRTYLMLYKPRGYVTTLSDEKGRRTVADLTAGCGARVWPVGRLDLDSEGLLLMTDDGALTHKLLHPGSEIEKVYLVTVRGDLEEALPVLNGPIFLDGVRLAPAVIRVLNRGERKRALLSVIIHEGKNRQIRRMCAAAGLEVLRLKRVREGAITLGGLRPGQWRRLTAEEIRCLTLE